MTKDELLQQLQAIHEGAVVGAIDGRAKWQMGLDALLCYIDDERVRYLLQLIADDLRDQVSEN